MIKGSIHEEDIIILNVYAPHNVASKYMKQNPKESQGEIRQILSMARILILMCWKFSGVNRTSICRATWKCGRSDTTDLQSLHPTQDGHSCQARVEHLLGEAKFCTIKQVKNIKGSKL